MPADPEVRAAALASAQRQLQWMSARWVRVVLGFMTGSAVLSLVLEVLDDDRGWRLLPRVGTLVVFGFLALQPRLLRRRVKALSLDDAG
ncbi:hypothetical protein [Kribbella italica]|uniref:Uncharacterized protein n=1 Tax=Kribbella italica TaxID=1540520 RepID=A0A7W9J5I9_9ACTN|nr:hypothetical protein [Kribbella italica]MBB5835898.1 hypothetical protein [Kribbella italica]